MGKSKRKNFNNASMASFIRALRIRLLVFIAFEIAVLATGVIFYFYDFPQGFKAFMTDEYWIFATCAVFVLNMMVLWFALFRLSSLRHRMDIDAASIIGSDVQEAYNFGGIGLVVVDINDTVLWCSNLLKDRHINLLDMNIFEWRPELEDLRKFSDETTTKIEVNGRVYEVRYLADARLFIFKDISDFQASLNYSRDQAIVIGVIMIDNFSDIVGQTEDDNNDLVARLRAEILDYCREKNVLLRRYRNDSYFAVCNYVSLAKMEADAFSVLTRVRMLGLGQSVTPTLSIGFAHDFPDVTKLNEMASSAIDMAMSRGGDQAVVSHYGQELKFFGGKTAVIENTTGVKFRSFADALIGAIKDSSDVIVAGHLDMDMDALGGCIGVLSICEHLGKPCRIIVDPKLMEKKTKGAFLKTFPTPVERGKVEVSPRDALARFASSSSTLFVVVDVSVPTRVLGEKCLDKASKIIVIDHHRRGESYIENTANEYIDPSASSASEILAEFIRYASMNPRIEIPARYATTMLSGIFLDTNFFKSNAVGIRTFEAAEVLREFGADPRTADYYLKDELAEYELVNQIASTMKSPYRGILYAHCDERDSVDRATLAKTANALMTIRDIRAVFVIGRSDKEWCLSARSDQSVNVQLLCEKMGGGGRFDAAACSFKEASYEVVERKLLETLRLYLSEASSGVEGGEAI